MTSGVSSLQRPSLASSPSRYVTVLDVYDLAESINRDFECIAERFGKENIESIVRKVICALETLEALAKNNDSENAEIADLQREIQHLEHEKQQRLQNKNAMEKDISEMEENYKKEIDELCRVVRSLQSENKSIKRRLDAFERNGETRNSGTQSPEPGVVTVKEEEFQMMLDLRSTSIKQKEEIKELQRDVDNYVSEVDSLQSNIEKLIYQNTELLRKNASLQKQGRLLVQERADLQRRWHRTEEANLHLRRLLSEASRACADLEAEKQYESESDSSQRFTLEELREILQEKTTLKARVIELEEQLDIYRGQSTSSAASVDTTCDRETENLREPIVSSTRLSYYLAPVSSKADVVPESSSMHTPTTSNEFIEPSDQKKLNAEKKHGIQRADSEECLVYGPINREPDEKLNPIKYERKNSGVRKLFRFFKELNTGSGGGWSPRRPSSNLNSSSLISSPSLKPDSS